MGFPACATKDHKDFFIQQLTIAQAEDSAGLIRAAAPARLAKPVMSRAATLAIFYPPNDTVQHLTGTLLSSYA